MNRIVRDLSRGLKALNSPATFRIDTSTPRHAKIIVEYRGASRMVPFSHRPTHEHATVLNTLKQVRQALAEIAP